MNPKKYPQVSPIDRALQLHFSTLEKTKIDHNPLVNKSDLDVSTGFPVLSSIRTDFPRSCYPYEVLPGFDEAEEDTNESVLAVTFMMGRDLAVTRPSPDSC